MREGETSFCINRYIPSDKEKKRRRKVLAVKRRETYHNTVSVSRGTETLGERGMKRIVRDRADGRKGREVR